MVDRRSLALLLLSPALCVAQLAPSDRPRPALSYWREGPLLFIGTSHTNSIDDPQIKAMHELIVGFRADIALVEGGEWPEFADPTDAIASYGELAYAKSLAKSLGVRAEDADPNIDSEHMHTVTVHGADRTRLYYALRMVPQFARAAQIGGPSVDESMARWLKSGHLGDLPEASVPLDSVNQLQELCSRELPSIRDWQNAANGKWWSTRGAPETFLQAVQATAAAFRDRYIVSRVASELKAGKRVLVVAGAAHMVAAHNMLPSVLQAQ